MNHPILLVLITGLLIGLAPAGLAQISNVQGWQASHATNAATFRLEQASQTAVYQVRAPQARQGEGWFAEAVAADVRQEGWREAKPGLSNSVFGMSIYMTEVEQASGQKWLVGYLAYPLGDARGRLGRIQTSPDQAFFKSSSSTATDHFTKLALKEGGFSLASKPSTSNQPAQEKPVTAQSEMGNKPANVPAAKPGQGLSASQLKQVIMHLEYKMGVGGAIYPTYNAYLLLADGSIYKQPTMNPYDLDVAASRRDEPEKWGTWRAEGGGLQVSWPSERRPADRSSFWKATSYKEVSPARQGETLTGQFKTISGTGNTALGGDAMVVASANITFASNGQFTLAKSGGGSVGNWASSSKSHETGTYRLEKYTIELKYQNGHVERRFFYFYPDSRQHFGIGKSAYLPTKGE
jgi:hypothetical protein